MELRTTRVLDAEPQRVYLTGKETVTLSPGKHLKIETSPAGQEILDAIVPVGKVWSCFIQVTVEEVDA